VPICSNLYTLSLDLDTPKPRGYILTPSSLSLHPSHKTLHPEPQTLTPFKLFTLHAAPWTLSPDPPIPNPKP